METLDTRRGRDDAFRLLLLCRGLQFKIVSSSGHKIVSLLDKNNVQVAQWDVTVRENELYVYRRKCNPSKLTSQQCDALVAYRLTQLQSTGDKAIRFAHNGGELDRAPPAFAPSKPEHPCCGYRCRNLDHGPTQSNVPARGGGGDAEQMQLRD